MTVKELEALFANFQSGVNNTFSGFDAKFTGFDEKLSGFEEKLGNNFVQLNSTLDDFQKSVTADILAMREVMIKNLVKQNRDLNIRTVLLEDRLMTVEDRLAKVERQINQAEQNNRKNNVEISGIPDTITDEQLPVVVAQILDHVVEDEEISTNDVEACHRLSSKSSPKPTIVRMRRNLLEKAKRNSKKLKGVDVALGLPQGSKLFINENLSPRMKNLAYNARLLKNQEWIDETWFSNAAVRIKYGGKTFKITHETDLLYHFKEFPNFTFDKDFCMNVLYENPEAREMRQCDDLDGAWNDLVDPDGDPEGVANMVREVNVDAS